MDNVRGELLCIGKKERRIIEWCTACISWTRQCIGQHAAVVVECGFIFVAKVEKPHHHV